MFVTQLSSNSGISFWRIVCDAMNCCFMTDMAVPKSMWDSRFFRPCWWWSNSFGIWLTYWYQRVLHHSWSTGILTYTKTKWTDLLKIAKLFLLNFLFTENIKLPALAARRILVCRTWLRIFWYDCTDLSERTQYFFFQISPDT